jgi:hypothetical protein
MNPTNKPIFHRISKRLVSAQISRAIRDLSSLNHKPVAPSTLDAWIERQKSYYAAVQIRHDRDGYRLIYGNDKVGTGPFRTLKMAREWFLNGGR